MEWVNELWLVWSDRLIHAHFTLLAACNLNWHLFMFRQMNLHAVTPSLYSKCSISSIFCGYARCIDRELREFKCKINTWTVYLNECIPLGNNQQHQFIHLFNWHSIASNGVWCLCVCTIARDRMYTKIVWKLKWDFNDKMNMTTSAIIKTSKLST